MTGHCSFCFIDVSIVVSVASVDIVPSSKTLARMKFYTYWSNRILLSANTFAKFCVYVRIFACFVSNQNFSVLYFFYFFSGQIFSVLFQARIFSSHWWFIIRCGWLHTLLCLCQKLQISERSKRCVKRTAVSGGDSRWSEILPTTLWLLLFLHSKPWDSLLHAVHFFKILFYWKTPIS